MFGHPTGPPTGGKPVLGFTPGPPLAADADLPAVAIERGIEFFLVAFVDIFGVLRSKMVPAPAIAQIQAAGAGDSTRLQRPFRQTPSSPAGFAPFASWLDYGPDASDMLAIPDPTSLIQVIPN